MRVGTLVRHYTETGWNVHGFGVVTEVCTHRDDKGKNMVMVHWTNTQPCMMTVRILREVAPCE